MPSGVYEKKIRSDKGGSYPINFVHSKHENVFVNGLQKNRLPPLEILKWLFRYDSESGKLYKIRGSNGKAVEPAREITTVDGNGYLHVSITDSNGLEKKVKVHQLIYYMHSNVEPLQIVDHIDGDPRNNLFSNLRLATESENNRNQKMRSNNTSGVTGVFWYKSRNKWVAQAHDNSGRQKTLGYYLDKEDAARVVSAYYANPSNGYTERHGKQQ